MLTGALLALLLRLFTLIAIVFSVFFSFIFHFNFVVLFAAACARCWFRFIAHMRSVATRCHSYVVIVLRLLLLLLLIAHFCATLSFCSFCYTFIYVSFGFAFDLTFMCMCICVCAAIPITTMIMSVVVVNVVAVAAINFAVMASSRTLYGCFCCYCCFFFFVSARVALQLTSIESEICATACASLSSLLAWWHFLCHIYTKYPLTYTARHAHTRLNGLNKSINKLNK